MIEYYRFGKIQTDISLILLSWMLEFKAFVGDESRHEFSILISFFEAKCKDCGDCYF